MTRWPRVISLRYRALWKRTFAIERADVPEAAADGLGQPHRLVNADLVILDELGYLPFVKVAAPCCYI